MHYRVASLGGHAAGHREKEGAEIAKSKQGRRVTAKRKLRILMETRQTPRKVGMILSETC